MATCYGDSLLWLTSGEPGTAMTNDGWQEFRPWLRDLLLEWHRLDPVSPKELKRAIEVNKIQGNRNPFMAYPELVGYIWGSKQGQTVDFYSLTQRCGDQDDDTKTDCSSVSANNSLPRKIFLNGSLYILMGNRTYSVLGL